MREPVPVHGFLPRPLLDLAGLSYLCDALLHMMVPAVAVVGWLVDRQVPVASLR